MKENVIQMLTDRDLLHVFSESEFNYYKRQAIKGGNQYLMALTIADRLIFNYIKPVPTAA